MAQIITGVIIEKSTSLTFEEFCHAMQARSEVIIQMIEDQLLQPQGEAPEDWRFDSLSLKRGRIAMSFYRDLEVNMTGVALALELLEKIERLQKQVDILEGVKF